MEKNTMRWTPPNWVGRGDPPDPYLEREPEETSMEETGYERRDMGRCIYDEQRKHSNHGGRTF